MDILKHVDILDLIEINVYRADILDKGAYSIDLIAIDKNKRVILDTDAAKILETHLVEKTQEFKSVKDPRVVDYMKEFTGRMCYEWHKNGLLELEDIPEASDDSYAEIRNAYKRR